MSALDDLKNTNDVVIDAVNGETNEDETPNKVVSMSDVKPIDAKPKTVVKPKPVNTDALKPHTVDIADIAAQEEANKPAPKPLGPGDMEIQPGVSIKDMLSGKDFQDTLARKKAETEAAIAWDEEQAAAKKDDEELDQETDSNDSVNEGSLIQDSPEELSNGNQNLHLVGIDDVDEAVNNNDAEVSTETTVDEETTPEDDLLNNLDKATEKDDTPKKVVENPDIDIETTLTSNTAVDEEETPVVEEDEDADDEDNDAILKDLQRQVTEKIKPLSKSLNISSFTVSKRPTTNLNRYLNNSEVKVIKWVLPDEKAVVLMKEFTGAELENLRQMSEDTRSLQQLSRRYRMIYDHIMSPKPQSFEAWLKITPVIDVEHLFFAIYVASFNGANYVPMDCVNDKCNYTFVTDNIKIMDMVKFDTDKDKDLFTEVYTSEPTMLTDKGLYTVEKVPISANIAVSFREPSIYNLFELASLSDNFREKYSNVVEYLPYIDEMYIIDQTNTTLIPIEYQTYPNNARRTVESKVRKYNSVINSLDIDEFGLIRSYSRAMGERTTGMHYIYPATTCPKCGTERKEVPASAEEMVFTRYQLGALVSTSVN